MNQEEKRRFGDIVPNTAQVYTDQAAGLRILASMRKGKQARVIAVTSGKGGVGKTTLSVNLAISLAESNKRVVVVDLDLGLGSVDVMLDIKPVHNLSHVLNHKRTISEIVHKAGKIWFIPSACGVEELANLTDEARDHLIEGLRELWENFDYVIFDTQAGISRNTIGFVASADDCIIVTTPEPTAAVDAFAVVKLLAKEPECGRLHIVVNSTGSTGEAQRILDGISKTAGKLWNVNINSLGFIFKDEIVPTSIKRQRPFVISYPYSKPSSCIYSIVRAIKNEPDFVQPRQPFLKRLLSVFK